MAIKISFSNKYLIDFDCISPGEWFTSRSFPNCVFLKTDDINYENNVIGFEGGCAYGELYSFDGDDQISTDVKFNMYVGGTE